MVNDFQNSVFEVTTKHQNILVLKNTFKNLNGIFKIRQFAPVGKLSYYYIKTVSFITQKYETKSLTRFFTQNFLDSMKKIVKKIC